MKLTQNEIQEISNRLILELPQNADNWPTHSILELAATGREVEGLSSSGNFKIIGAHSSLTKPERIVVGKRIAKSPKFTKTQKNNARRRILYAAISRENFERLRSKVTELDLDIYYGLHAGKMRLFKKGEARSKQAQLLSEIIIFYTEVYNRKGILIKPIGKPKDKEEKVEELALT